MSVTKNRKTTRRKLSAAASSCLLAALALILVAGSGAKTRPRADAGPAGAVQNAPAALNLKDFGATGDGTTDDGPALQSALDALAAAGGGTLFVPAGSYAIVTPVSKDFSGLDGSVTISGVVSDTPVPPPTAKGDQITRGLDLTSEFLPRTGTSGIALRLVGIRSVTVNDIAFVGTPNVNTDANHTLLFADDDDATVSHCEFYGLSSMVGSDVFALRTRLKIARSVFLGCTANSGVYTSVVQNLEWKGFTIEEAVFADYGQRPDFFGKLGVAAPYSWIEVGNAAAVTNDSPRREAVFNSVFLDEGGFVGIASDPTRYTSPQTVPIDLVYITGLWMNVSNLGTWGNYLSGLQATLVEDSAYGWSHNSDAAINIAGVGDAVLDRVETSASATRLRADAATARLTVIDSTYTDLASLSPHTVVINTTQPGEDPVQYVRDQFESALGRAPYPSAHFFWSDGMLRCGSDAQCLASSRAAFAAYLATSPSENFGITGLVKDELGAPVAGALVALTGSQTVSTTTDASGLYHFSNLPTSGVYTVTVSKPHYTFASPSQTFTTPAADVRGDFAGAEVRHTVSGHVADDAGHALAGATLTLTGSQTATTTTDASGNYSFTKVGEGGNYTVTPSKTDYAFTPASQSFTNLSADSHADFTAASTVRSISGVVADAKNVGLAGVSVALTGSQTATTTTAADGSFHFDRLPVGGNYVVKPTLLGYVFSPASQSFNNLSADQRAVFAGTYVEYKITGRVAKSDGTAVPGVTVSLAGSKSATTTTDSGGNYSFANVPSGGNYTVTPSKTDYTFSPAALTLSALGSDRTASFTATPGTHAIKGRVTGPGGAALAGATLTLSGSRSATATADANGNYSFTQLPSDGTYTITASKTDYAFTPPSQTFSQPTADKTADFAGALVNYRIAGRVTEGASGLAGVTISLTGSQTATATTDANGSYSFSVTAEGNYTVTPSKPHYTFAPQASSFNNLSGDKTANFAATLTRHTISGRVTKQDGSVLAGATLALTGSQTATATSDASGNYSFANLGGGGNYTVTASKANYTFAPPARTFADLSSNQSSDFTATLLDYHIGGHVTENGSALAGVAVTLTGSRSASATTDANGSYSFTVPAEGNYTVTASKANYTITPPSQTFNALGGDKTADFTAALLRFSILGRVADAGNAGLAGVTLTLTGSQTGTTTTDASGNYSFTNLVVNGTYTVTPTLRYGTFTPASQTFASLGADARADFVGGFAVYHIAGHVTEKGAGLGGVTVDLAGTHPQLGATAERVLTAADGSYSFNVTAGGNYSVTPSSKDYTFAPASASFGAVEGDHTADFAATHRPVVEFGAAALSVGEGDDVLEVTVTRSGDTSAEGSAVYEVQSGTALRGSDVVGSAGRVTFAPGETTKTFEIFITDDSLVEGAEQFSIKLTPEGTAIAGDRPSVEVTINDNDTDASAPNAIDDAEFFVRQHYRDFLGRDPDAPGLAFWTNQLKQCGSDTACRDAARINVSAAFFLSIEFQETGFFVYKTYEAAYGRTPDRLEEFTLDSRAIGADLIVGETGWEQKLEAGKAAYVQDFVSRPEFQQRYPITLTPAQYVSALNANTGGSLSAQEQAGAVAEFDGLNTTEDLPARARVLRRVVENAAFNKRETDPAFVLMQYYGYLRREPDEPPDTNLDGYNFWLKKLEDFGGDFKRAEMVKAFLSSDEYRKRFGK